MTATEGTNLFTLDSTYDTISPSIPANNGTDFAFFQSAAHSVTLSAATAFSLQSFNAGQLFNSTAAILTVTGFNGVSQTIQQIVNTLGGNTWSLYTLTDFTDVTSVTIVAQNDYVGLDNITVNEPVPEPTPFLLLGTALAGLGWFRRRSMRNIS